MPMVFISNRVRQNITTMPDPMTSQAFAFQTRIRIIPNARMLKVRMARSMNLASSITLSTSRTER